MSNVVDYFNRLKQTDVARQPCDTEEIINALLCTKGETRKLLNANKSEREALYHELSREFCSHLHDQDLLSTALSTLRQVLRLSDKNTTPKREAPGYSELAELHSHSVDKLYQNVVEEVKQFKEPPTNVRMQWALFFSVCSGIGFPELLDALFQIIVTTERPLQKTGNFLVLPIDYRKNSHLSNVNEKGTHVNQRLFYPDPLATAAISGLLKVKVRSFVTHSSAEKELTELFKRVSPNSGFTNLALRSQLHAIAAWLFRQPGAEISMWQRRYMEGVVQSASMSVNCLSSQQGFKINKSQIKHLHVQAIAKEAGSNVEIDNKPIASKGSDRFIEELRAILSNPKQSLVAKQDTLQALIDQGISISEEVLVAWFLNNFKTRKWKQISSAERHLSALGKSWLTHAATYQLDSLDIADVTQLYEQIVDDKKSDDAKVLASLSSITLFMGEYLGTPIPDSFEGGHVGCVRSSVISESLFQRLLIDTERTFATASEHARQCIKVSLILMRRLGLRPHELDLRIGDIEVDGFDEIVIRRNLKTASARRVLRPALYMIGDEFQWFCTFIKKRRHQTLGDKEHPVFTLDPRYAKAIDFQKLARVCSKLLSTYLGEPTPLYQLRHSALSNLQLILFGDNELVELFTPYTKDQAELIKSSMNQGAQQDLLYQLSSHAGHLSQRITLSTYCHFSDILLYQQIRKSNRKYPSRFWSCLLNIRPSTWEKYNSETVTSGSQGAFTPVEAERGVQHYVRNINRLTQKKQGADTMNTVILEHIGSPTPTLMDVDTILRTHDDALKCSPAEITKNLGAVTQALGLHEHWGPAVVSAARAIKESGPYKTTKGKSRLYPHLGPRLTPPLPNSAAEMDDADQIQRNLVKLTSVQLQQVRVASNMLFQRIAHNHNETIFARPSELQDFLTGIRHLVCDNRWYLVLNPHHGSDAQDQLKDWKENCDFPNDANIAIDGKVVDERRYPNGRLNLYFQRTTKVKVSIPLSEVEKYSSNTLKYVLHLHAILRGSEKKYQQLENQSIN